MITVKPIQSKDEQKRLCELFGAPYMPEALAYSADDDDIADKRGGFVGICQFTLTGGRGVIASLDFAEGADESAFIAGRAAITFIKELGIKDIACSERISEKMAFALTHAGCGNCL